MESKIRLPFKCVSHGNFYAWAPYNYSGTMPCPECGVLCSRSIGFSNINCSGKGSIEEHDIDRAVGSRSSKAWLDNSKRSIEKNRLVSKVGMSNVGRIDIPSDSNSTTGDTYYVGYKPAEEN